MLRILTLRLLVILCFFLGACAPKNPVKWVVSGDQGQTWLLGYSVATAGDVNGDGYADVIIGAPKYSGSGSEFRYAKGLVQVYYGSRSGLSSNPEWTAMGEPYSHFGWSVASAGDVNGDGFDDVIVGAPSEYNPERPAPKAYVFFGSPSGLDLNGARPVGSPSNADWEGTASSEQGGFSRYGLSVASAGDINNDTFADIIIGAPGHNGYPIEREGWAYVYHGSAAGISVNSDWTYKIILDADSLFGWSVSTAGDVNGDGFSDTIVGAPGFNEKQYFPPTSDVGAVFVFHGSTTGLSSEPDWEILGPFTEDMMYGKSVATAGDVNDDGIGDVIVGHPNYSGQPQFGLGDGRVDVYLGTANGLDYNSVNSLGTWADWSSTDCNNTYWETNYGYSVATAGDVDGDGISDIIIGAPYTHTANDKGQFCVFYGSTTGLPFPPLSGDEWSVLGTDDNARFGWSVASAGDVNGDYCDEVIIGAPFYSTSTSGTYTEGRVHLYYTYCPELAPSP